MNVARRRTGQSRRLERDEKSHTRSWDELSTASVVSLIR